MIPSFEDLQDTPGNFNILLMGKHGTNVDTIIFANINANRRKVTLVSVPRDLYVEERKINSVYGLLGIREQVRSIEEVIGYRIHKYALVDMYVFRDIIDLMGGVDIELATALIDPTYKTCDNGVCTTLYYESGTHHVNGTQALRVARSRYSTSDFSRAARQQIILDAIQNRVRSMGVGDAVTLKNLISTVINSLETNVSVDEALRYFFRYKDFEIQHGHVISTANVLNPAPIPVDVVTSHPIWICGDEMSNVGEGELPDGCEFGHAMDALLPREDNWDVIPWYVQSAIES